MAYSKRAVLEDVNYDFLKEHVESIPDPVEKEKKQRKPRAPKDPSVSTSAGSAPTGSAPRKRKASAKAQQTTQQHFSAQNGVSLLQDEQDSEERRKSDEDFDFDAANRAADSGNDQESDSATSTPTVPSRMMPDEDEDYDA